MKWDQFKFFDDLGREARRLEECPHLAPVEIDTFVLALEMVRISVLDAHPYPTSSGTHVSTEDLQALRDALAAWARSRNDRERSAGRAHLVYGLDERTDLEKGRGETAAVVPFPGGAD